MARGDTILVERYQYAQTDRHRFTSFSMAKTVTAMLVGIAIAESLIRSVDDPAGTEPLLLFLPGRVNAAGVAAFFAPGGSLTINGGTPSVGRSAITEVAQGFMTATASSSCEPPR